MELYVPPEIVHQILDGLKRNVPFRKYRYGRVLVFDGLMPVMRFVDNTEPSKYEIKEHKEVTAQTANNLRCVSKCFAAAYDPMWICTHIGGNFGRKHNTSVMEYGSWLSSPYLKPCYQQTYIKPLASICTMGICYMMRKSGFLLLYEILKEELVLLKRINKVAIKYFTRTIQNVNVDDPNSVNNILNKTMNTLVKVFSLPKLQFRPKMHNIIRCVGSNVILTYPANNNEPMSEWNCFIPIIIKIIRDIKR